MEDTNWELSGEQLTIPKAIANLQQKEDLGLRYYAAWWLGKFRVKETTAIEALLEALQDHETRAPNDEGYPLIRNAARALGKLGDLRAVKPLMDCLDIDDFYVREAAAQSLEMLGDPQCIPKLLNLLEGGVAAAQMVSGKPHLVQPYEAILEALGTLGAYESCNLIEPFLEHFVPKVRYAATRALYQLTNNTMYGEKLVQALEAPDLQLRRSALMDIGAVGYLGGAEAIANTLAENSLKLIALKGLLEKYLENNDPLEEQGKKLMQLMDQLL